MNRTDAFTAILSRRSVRKFSATPVSEAELLGILECANRAPSGFNLQPWEFLVIRDTTVRKKMLHVCMNQTQVVDAPVVVAVLADRDAWRRSFPAVVEASVRSGVWDKARATRYMKVVRMHFRTGPFGIFGFLKRIALPMLRLRQPFPAPITSTHEAEEYVMRQAMLALESLMLAANAIGIDSSPMEGFDEDRLKRLLQIPSRMRVVSLVALGRRAEGSAPTETFRFPIAEKLWRDVYGRR